jgi:hypothetical protein
MIPSCKAGLFRQDTGETLSLQAEERGSRAPRSLMLDKGSHMAG